MFLFGLFDGFLVFILLGVLGASWICGMATTLNWENSQPPEENSNIFLASFFFVFPSGIPTTGMLHCLSSRVAEIS